MQSPKTRILLQLALMLGAAAPAYSQAPLPEVVVRSMHYKYVNSVTGKDLAEPVRILEGKAAQYDVRKEDVYEDDNGQYSVSFYLPQGTILATYDSSGKLLQTAEHYANITLPKAVSGAVASRYPDWGISKDAYLVNYLDGSGASKVYKLKLVNGSKRMRVKLNDKGEFL